MPSWNEVLIEIMNRKEPSAIDSVRRKYLKALSKKTGRNIIAYYSGWLQKPGAMNTSISDDDKNGFMATIHKLNRTKGLDLLLHTPGGDIAATESIVNYLREMFGKDIRAIIPQIAMSTGTMIACSCKEIIMGKQSNIGPIDPQFNGIPAHGVLEEFQDAIEKIKENPQSLPIWQIVIGKYHPTFLGECKKIIEWSTEIVCFWLESNMFEGDPEAKKRAHEIVNAIGSHEATKTHARHIHIDEALGYGLKIKAIEKDFDDGFQDLVLTIHHAFMHTFANSKAVKIVENQLGNAIISNYMSNM